MYSYRVNALTLLVFSSPLLSPEVESSTFIAPERNRAILAQTYFAFYHSRIISAVLLHVDE